MWVGGAGARRLSRAGAIEVNRTQRVDHGRDSPAAVPRSSTVTPLAGAAVPRSSTVTPLAGAAVPRSSTVTPLAGAAVPRSSTVTRPVLVPPCTGHRPSPAQSTAGGPDSCRRRAQGARSPASRRPRSDQNSPRSPRQGFDHHGPRRRARRTSRALTAPRRLSALAAALKISGRASCIRVDQVTARSLDRHGLHDQRGMHDQRGLHDHGGEGARGHRAAGRATVRRRRSSPGWAARSG